MRGAGSAAGATGPAAARPAGKAAPEVVRPAASTMGAQIMPQTRRSTISALISAIASAGFSPLGQALAQFMMVWQR